MTGSTANQTARSGAPRISVMVPLYNVAHVVSETIDSLLAQTLAGVEYILIDDGSTDGTFEIVRHSVGNNPAFTLVGQTNQGPSAARNHALRLAAGDYLFFLDGDDVLPPDALANLYTAATEHDADIAIGQMVRWDGSRTWPIAQYISHGVYTPGRKHITTHPGLLYAMGPTAKLYRRDRMAGVFFPEDMRLGEDQPFVLQAYLNADVIYVIDTVVYFYRVSDADTPSLTAQALKQPTERLSDLYQMVALANGLLSGQEELFAYYVNRVMLSDILPRFRAAMHSRDADTQRTAIESLGTWLQTLDERLFRTVPGLRAHLRMNLMLCRRHVQPAAADAYRNFTRVVHKRTPFLAVLGTIPLLTSAVIRRLKR